MSVLNIIQNKQLTFQQKVIQLAQNAENSIEPIELTEEIKDFFQKKILCDLNEGNAPFKPRYILPDYDKFMKNGSRFLELEPPKTLLEAVNNLLILYRHTPSVTTFPVFLGYIDRLLEPFVEDENSAYPIIKMFLTHIDRTLTDSFVHANIGPRETKVGRLILKAERELCRAVPNLSLIYSDETSDEFALEAVKTGLTASKPYFINHKIQSKDYDGNYGIASCYNGLPLGGGSYTLARLNLKYTALESKNIDDFFENILPKAVRIMVDLMNRRIAFLVEESGFFESNFHAEEGLIDKNRFTAMFGIHGLAECANHLSGARNKSEKFGNSTKTDDLGVRIMDALETEINKYNNKYCKISNGKFVLHAQCGIGSDVETSPGARINPEDEPEIFEKIQQNSRFHKYFPSGTSDIFQFDEMSKKNPQYVLDIIKGAMKAGLRTFAFGTSNCEVVRITGYLVKRRDIEKYKIGEKTLEDTVVLGLESTKSLNIEKRRVNQISGKQLK